MAEHITARELYDGLISGAVPEVIDVRAPEDFTEARIDIAPHVPVRNVPLWDALDDPVALARSTADGVVLVCAHGNGSDMVADMVTEAGKHARNLEGGMLAWSALLVPLPIATGDGPVSGWQLQRPAKGCLSYVIGVPGAGCIVVDPARFPEAYMELANEHGMRIRHVVDTHLHADHVSGGLLLAREAGATYSVPAEDAGNALVGNHPLQDGQHIDLGGARLQAVALHLPGHTPGTIALVLQDRLLLGGDTIFVRGVGRPDLTGQARELATQLFRTIHDRLSHLDPATLVLPAHWTNGDEMGADGLVATTLAEVFATPLMQEPDFDRFLEEIIATLPAAPAIYDRIREINAGAPADEYELEHVEVGRNQCAASAKR